MNAKSLKTKTITYGLLIVCLISASALFAAAMGRRQGYLGVSVERLSRDEREELKVTHGVIVADVVAKSPAEMAGIREDDVIQYFNGEKIRTPDDLVEAVRDTEPKKTVKVTLHREGKRMDIDVAVGRLRSSYTLSYGGNGNVITVMGGGGGYLGVQLQELNRDLAPYFGVEEDGGALVLRVESESPAAEAGMKGGDVIVEIDEEEIWDPQDVRDILSDFEVGD